MNWIYIYELNLENTRKMARFSSFQIVLILIASFVAIHLVTSQESDEDMKEYCEQKNDTLDIAMTVVFSCHINATVSIIISISSSW